MPRRKTPTKPSAAIEQPSLPGIVLRSLDLRPHKTLRLAVSGDVALNRIETRVVDTPAFQRLRHIRQLGAACWVYPTALHTRFDHSLGTLEMTRRMIQALRDNVHYPDAWRRVSVEQEQLARLFALLHDISHVPFGHTVEDECGVFKRHDGDRSRIEYFLGRDSTIGRLLLEGIGEELYERLLALFLAAAGVSVDLGEDHFILDLITGTICADLLDYLQRDAWFCNLSIDTDYRFLRHLAIVPHKRRRRLVIQLWKDGAAQPRRDVLNKLKRMHDNRYLLGERVYFQHAKLVTGAMIGGAVARAVQEGDLTREDLLTMGDDVLLWQLGRSRVPAVARLAQALAARAIWKTVYVRTHQTVVAEQQAWRADNLFADLMRRFHDDAVARVATEDRLACLLGFDAGELLIHCPHHHMAMKEAGTLVFWNGALRPLKDCSDDPLIGARLQAILDSHQNLWALRVFTAPGRRGDAYAVAQAGDALLTY